MYINMWISQLVIILLFACWVNFHWFVVVWWHFFQNWLFLTNSFRSTIRVSNDLDLNQDPHSVSPDLGQTVCKGHQQMTKFITSKEGVMKALLPEGGLEADGLGGGGNALASFWPCITVWLNSMASCWKKTWQIHQICIPSTKGYFKSKTQKFTLEISFSA